MRSYWLRILLGACAVFAVGMVFVTLIRHGRSRVHAVFASSQPLSFPLPFVPFTLDGNKLGTVERLVVNREAPKKVSSVELQVKLEDSLVAQGLAGCRLAANVESDSTRPGDLNIHVNRLDERTFFFCTKSDSGFEEFGSVELTPGDVTLPLLVPESLAERLRSGDWANEDSTDAMAERAESLADRAEEIADSAAEAGGRAAAIGVARSKLGDSLRAEGKRRADSLRRALGRMADSLEAR